MQRLPAAAVPGEREVFPRAVNWSNPRVGAILEAAVDCFSGSGFNTTTLAQIGAKLGQRKSIVHYYFASKAALVEEVQSFVYARYLQTLRSTISDAPPSALSDVLRTLWQRLGQQPTTRWLSVEYSGESRHDSELEARERVLHQQVHQLIASYLMQGQAESRQEDCDQLADLTHAVLNGLSILAERDHRRAERALARFGRLLDQ